MTTLLTNLLARFRQARKPGHCDMCGIALPQDETRCDACWWLINAY